MAEKYVEHDEAVKMVGKSEDEFKKLVQDKGLRVFRDAGTVKYLRAEVRRAAGLPAEAAEAGGAGEEPESQAEEFDFLAIAEEEEQGDTASDTISMEREQRAEMKLEPAEEARTEEPSEVTGETSETLEAGKAPEEIPADEGELWAPVSDEEEESTGQVPTAPLLEELTTQEEEPGTGEVETSALLAESKALEGEEEAATAPAGLSGVEEEGEEIRVKRRARRPMARGAPAEKTWIMLVVASVLLLFSGLLILDQYVGAEAVPGWFAPIQSQLLKIVGG